MSDLLGPVVAAEVARRAQHPYAVHPATLILADHEVSRWTRQGTVAHCTCGTNVSCAATGVEYAAHLVEALVREGLLPEPDTLRVLLAGRRETHWGNATPDGDHVPRESITDARRTFKSRGWPIIRRVTIEGPWEPTTDWAGLLKEEDT